MVVICMRPQADGVGSALVPSRQPADRTVVHLICRLSIAQFFPHASICRQTQTAGTGAAQVFSRRPADQAIMQLVMRYPGVRHRIVHDAAQVRILP